MRPLAPTVPSHSYLSGTATHAAAVGDQNWHVPQRIASAAAMAAASSGVGM